MLRRNYIAFVIFVFPLVILNAQPPDLKETYLEAEAYFLFEEFNEALPLYLRIHRADPDNDDVNYKIGICFLNDPYQKEKSIRYLKTASANVNPKYKENSYKERTAPLETYFYLGNAYLVNNELDNALENYRYFREILDEDIYDVELVEEQIRMCERAKKLMQNPVDFDLINLGEKINGRFSDINPIISGDGTKLVYVSKRQFYDATFYVEKVDGEWQTPRNVIPELGVDGDVYPSSLSYDGKKMIIYRNDDFIGNLYQSVQQNGAWTDMIKLGENINTKYWESHGSLSPDGNTLYFTSNRKGGYGGLDIYRSEIQSDGSWGEPVNLGDAINTRYNEDTPFLTENGEVLYFSSYGHYNIGGYDVFYSRKDDDGSWGNPVNIGYPINTTDDDIFFYPVDNGNSGYFSKYVESGFGRHDIYFMNIYSENNPRMYMITGKLNSDGELISSEDEMKIYLVNRGTGDTIMIKEPDLASQNLLLKAPKGDFNVIIRSKTYKELVTDIQINDSTDKQGVDISEDLVLEQKQYVPKVYTSDESRIGINEDSIADAIPGEEMNIRLNLIKDATLYVDLFYDSLLISSDTIHVNRRRMDYAFVPGDNKTIISLKQVEKNGDISLDSIFIQARVVNADIGLDSAVKKPALEQESGYQPPEDSGESVDSKAAIEEHGTSGLINLIATLSDEDIKNVLSTIPEEELKQMTREELLDLLIEKGIDPATVSRLEVIEITGNDPEILRKHLLENSDGALHEYLSELDLSKADIVSADELIKHLYDVADEHAFSSEDIDRLIIKTTEGNLSAVAFKRMLLEESEGGLKSYLNDLNLDDKKIWSKRDLVLHLSKQVGKEFTYEELFGVIPELIGDHELDRFIEYIINSAPASIIDFVAIIDLEQEGIHTIADLLNYLLDHTEDLGIEKEDLQRIIVDLLPGYFAAEEIPSHPAKGSTEESRKKSFSAKHTAAALLVTGFLMIIIILLRRRRKKEGDD